MPLENVLSALHNRFDSSILRLYWNDLCSRIEHRELDAISSLPYKGLQSSSLRTLGLLAARLPLEPELPAEAMTALSRDYLKP